MKWLTNIFLIGLMLFALLFVTLCYVDIGGPYANPTEGVAAVIGFTVKFILIVGVVSVIGAIWFAKQKK